MNLAKNYACRNSAPSVFAPLSLRGPKPAMGIAIQLHDTTRFHFTVQRRGIRAENERLNATELSSDALTFASVAAFSGACGSSSIADRRSDNGTSPDGFALRIDAHAFQRRDGGEHSTLMRNNLTAEGCSDQFAVSVSLGSGVTNLTLAGNAPIAVIGRQRDSVGHEGASTIKSDEGNDAVYRRRWQREIGLMAPAPIVRQ
jgi:hypothetical protein